MRIDGFEFELGASAGGLTFVRTPRGMIDLFKSRKDFELDVHDSSAGQKRMLSTAARFIAGILLGEEMPPPPVDLSALGRFGRSALEATASIPRGEVRSYAWVARVAGSPRGARAAGQAMRSNPLPLLVPCHRVVHSDGTPGGYGGSLALKKRLLESEGAGDLVAWRS